MSVIEIQRIAALVAWIFVGIWALRVARKALWVQIRTGTYAIAALSVPWIAFIVGSSGLTRGASNVHGDVLIVIWTFAFIETITVVVFGLLVWFAGNISATQSRILERMRGQ